jgi:16S rRNA U516 pseudouridylate synthase RsuA-like enzyme
LFFAVNIFDRKIVLNLSDMLAPNYLVKPHCAKNCLTSAGVALPLRYECFITLTEGKYHEIKRIFGSLGNKITFLKRISFAGIMLDESLEEGEARYLTTKEENLFTK